MDEIIKNIAVYALPILFAITLHEAAHGYTARHFRDDTAAKLGRLSLNPANHIDPFGTIVLPLVMFIISKIGGGFFLFGYAKPVPVDFGKLRNPKRDMIWVAFAGPAANYLMAVFWTILGVLFTKFQVHKFFVEMAEAGISMNLVFFALNMFPLPPLDGGRVLVGLLPPKQAISVARMEPYGIFVVMLLAMTPLFYRYWINPVAYVLSQPLDFIVQNLQSLLN